MNHGPIRIITTDFDRMIKFNEKATGIPVKKLTENFAEIRTKTATLAIRASRASKPAGGQFVVKDARDQQAVFEFNVDDVDAD